jgi:hypothetical protein
MVSGKIQLSLLLVCAIFVCGSLIGSIARTGWYSFSSETRIGSFSYTTVIHLELYGVQKETTTHFGNSKSQTVSFTEWKDIDQEFQKNHYNTAAVSTAALVLEILALIISCVFLIYMAILLSYYTRYSLSKSICCSGMRFKAIVSMALLTSFVCNITALLLFSLKNDYLDYLSDSSYEKKIGV